MFNHHHPVSRLSCLCILAVLAVLPVRLNAATSLFEAATNQMAHQERFWRSCAKPSDTIMSRDLFEYALVLCEARQHPERLERLFELAEQMQDRNPKSRRFGNFWWSMRDGKVMDGNAVDFCMRGGTLLWLKHRDFIPAAAQIRLAKLLEFSVQGCSRHIVEPSYSNIAIMNAGDLILLGEVLGKPEVATEGYARLDRFFKYTQSFGIHEFNSPTYTGVDLDGLAFIEAFCQRPAGRNQARMLLELFWTDIALNWFPPAQKLAGAQSRTYDYLHGLGELDQELAMNGWLEAQIPTIYSAETRWHPSQKIHELSARFPRLVRESWGEDWWQSRTHYVQPDVTLSSTASSYGGWMDMPLTVDFPGERKSVRGYFIADGRSDPYGQKRVVAGAHQKAFHLNPFWTAAQRNGDALGLVVYREKDLPTNATTLVSNIVLPLAADGFWIGAQRVGFSTNTPSRLPVPLGEAVILRRGTAALGLRVPWTRGQDGRPASAFLVYDGNTFGAVRLAVEHVAADGKFVFNGNGAGAAFWLRVGSGLKTEAEFSQWRQRFVDSVANVNAGTDRFSIKISGADGPVELSAGAPWAVPASLVPVPTRAVLELNNANLGASILTTAAMP